MEIQMELETKNTEPNQPKSGKQPYQTPQLHIYGSIHEITRNVGPTGVLDNGGGGGAGPKTQ